MSRVFNLIYASFSKRLAHYNNMTNAMLYFVCRDVEYLTLSEYVVSLECTWYIYHLFLDRFFLLFHRFFGDKSRNDLREAVCPVWNLICQNSPWFWGQRSRKGEKVKSAPFRYIRANAISDVFEAYAQCDGEAQIIAGGQSLMPLLNMRLAAPKALIDINGIDALSGVTHSNGSIRICLLYTSPSPRD